MNTIVHLHRVECTDQTTRRSWSSSRLWVVTSSSRKSLHDRRISPGTCFLSLDCHLPLCDSISSFFLSGASHGTTLHRTPFVVMTRSVIADLPKPVLALNAVGGASSTELSRLLGNGGTLRCAYPMH